MATPINFEFKIELDRQLTIGGFQTIGSVGAAGAPLPPISAADQVKIRAMMEKLPPRPSWRNRRFTALHRSGQPLGSMGPIHKVVVKGQPVFLCCKGCEAEAKALPG